MEEKPEGREAVSEGGQMSRRRFLKYAGLGAVVVAGAGIAGYSALSYLSTPSRPRLQWWGVGTGNPERWDGLGDEVDFTDAAWDPVPVLNKMKADGRNIYDVISNAGTLDDPLFNDGSIVDFNPEEVLPSWSKIYPELRTNNPTITVQSTGQIVGVPIVQNGDSVAMNLDALWGVGTTQPGQGGDTYGLLFDDTWNGKTAMESSWACAVYKVANYLQRNNLDTLSSLETLSLDDLNKIKSFMLAQKASGQFRTFWTGWNTAVNLLATNEVVAMDTWEPVVFALRDRQPPVNAWYMAPKEGYYLWNIPLYMTPRGQSATLDRCLHLMEWTLQGWYGARITTIRGYLTATPDAISFAQANPDAGGGPYKADFIQSRHTLVKAKFSDGVSVYGNQAPPNIQQYQDTWTEVTA
ncbi:MAG TPA: extracellular solute-binding protein [Thermoplasmata archaeon]|jgi:putative spermidine/putrescine transport system substrate-binding protein|nr:extracellular solute-binding protein [Thermoplasmata archaeon]